MQPILPHVRHLPQLYVVGCKTFDSSTPSVKLSQCLLKCGCEAIGQPAMPAKTLRHGKGHICPPAVKVPDDGGKANVGVL